MRCTGMLFFDKYGEINIGETPISDAINTISKFPKKFSHHKFANTYWKCIVLKQINDTIVLQLIDESFERPKGNPRKRDAPYIYIEFGTDCDGTILKYSYKWQRWKLLICYLSGIILFCNLLAALKNYTFFSTRDIWAFIVLWGSMSALWIYWVTSNYKHDSLSICAFKALIQKCFRKP